MQLKMYLKDQLLESVEINPLLLKNINSVKQQMEQKHSDIIEISNADPVFFVEKMPSRIDEYFNRIEKKITLN